MSDETNILVVEHVGSRVTCNPPPTDTDDDWLYLVVDIEEAVRSFKKDGFYVDGSLMGGSIVPDDQICKHGLFVSLKHRHDVVNIIATSDTDFFNRFLAATQVCTRLNLMNKEDRIALFQAVLYGNRDG
jgi:hypothetical protein